MGIPSDVAEFSALLCRRRRRPASSMCPMSRVINLLTKLQHSLVQNVHKMNCFFSIWRTSSFWCRDRANPYVNLPLSLQTRLRSTAREALGVLEHQVLRSLDNLVTPPGVLKPQENLAVWACLWQLMLMYRDLMGVFTAKMARLDGSRKNAHSDFTSAAMLG